jgi:hypothetical protein
LLPIGCAFEPIEGEPLPVEELPPPLPPVLCGDLTCDPHAVCVTEAGGARCRCPMGFTGDGFTCADVDECATGNGGCPAACANREGMFTCYAPRTCADVKTVIPTWNGGAVSLYVNGEPAKRWDAYCTTSGREYLPLSQSNYSMYKGDQGEQDVRTTFTRIRIDPQTLLVDISDQSYASSTGILRHGSFGEFVTSMPYAVAMDCRGSNSSEGRARIDLMGTPFVVNDAWNTGGVSARGAATSGNNGRTFDVTGGGRCGWNGPGGTPYNPFNKIQQSPILQLEYRAP